MRVLWPNFKKRDGLVIVIAQEIDSNGRPGQILMQAYTDEAGYVETLETGNAVYWSTSRKERWCKGETSGNYQKVQDILIDCDGDTLIYLVTQEGEGACHTNAHSCFYRNVYAEGSLLMEAPNASEKEELPSFDVPVKPSPLGFKLARTR